MALIPCPDCGQAVSDEAAVCMHCGCPVRSRLERLQAEEEARRLEEQREKERQLNYIILGVIAVALFILIGSCISQNQHQPSTGTSLYAMSEQTQSLTPDAVSAFSASGTLKLDYSCQASAKSKASVQLVLLNTDNSAVVWEKAMKCPAHGSDTIQVKSGDYDVGASVNGDAIWTMNIIQR
jgi:transcription initiation factor TFIIIB Brf1 subunit/transcription initiation factor TFIIB